MTLRAQAHLKIIFVFVLGSFVTVFGRDAGSARVVPEIKGFLVPQRHLTVKNAATYGR